MSVAGIVVVLALSVIGSFLFSTLTYSLRGLSRVRLGEFLDRHQKSIWFDKTIDRLEDLTLVTAVLRMIANSVLVLACLGLSIYLRPGRMIVIYCIAACISCVITFFSSVAFPHALAEHASAEIVGLCVRPLHGLRFLFIPLLGFMRGIDQVVRNATGASGKPEAQEIEQEIMSAVEEGEKEGIVDEQEREMIESVIEFRDTTAGQVMTPRTEIVAIDAGAKLEHISELFEHSGHSRLPIYEGTIDQIIGILYARDLLRYVGHSAKEFDIKTAVRPAYYTPKTKPIRDLLRDFRVQKVQFAIVLDEYGGTAGVVSIHDVLGELIGDIVEENEPIEPSTFKRISESAIEVDAAIPIFEINRLTELNLPEDAGYETLGGLVSTTAGRIPERGNVIEYNGNKFVILEAEPQRINRIRIEMAPTAVAEAVGSEARGG
ncbi:MAG TPA: hemolysin family protein [Humisphaera sp.]|jgi:CBS domain containing-hemolysin-like protein|nr:hemolysin family protein [Humisphaera sp.]